MKNLRTSRSKINSLLCLRATPQLQPPLGYVHSHTIPLTLSHFIRINRPVSLILKINNFLAHKLFLQGLKKGMCVWKYLWFFFHPDTCGISFWQLREEADPYISHSRGLLWLAGTSEWRTGEYPQLWIHCCLLCSCKSILLFSLEGRRNGPPGLNNWAVQGKLATLHRNRKSTAF